MISVSGSPRLVRALLIPLVILAWLAVLVVSGWLLGHVTRAILLLILATLIAFALTPLVNLLNRWVPRAAAIAIAYVIGFGILIGLLALVIVTAAGESTNLAASLPSLIKKAKDLQPQILALLAPFNITASQLAGFEERLVAALQQAGADAASGALGLIQTVVSAFIDGVLILILSIYVMSGGPRLLGWMRSVVPAGQKRRAVAFANITDRVVGGYLRGTLTLALMVGLAVGIGMAVLHVRYALLLGVLAFFMEFVPVLGVLISGVVCVAVALLTGPLTALLVIVYFVVVHVLEGDVVGPRIMGGAVGIHPAVAIVALVAGSELFGIWGALFGAPIAGLIQAFIVEANREVRANRLAEARARERSAEPPAAAGEPAAGPASGPA